MLSNGSGPDELLEILQGAFPDRRVTSQIAGIENAMKFA